MRIGIDVDDTITNSYDSIMDLIGKKYSINSEKLKEAGTTYYDIMADNINFPDYDKFCASNFESLLSNVPLKEGAKEVINKLHEEGHQIVIISARNDKEYLNPYMTTYMYLVKHDILFDKIFVNILNKGEFCKIKKIDLFIDDSVINCKSAVNSGIRTFLFDNTFNKKNIDLKRVYNWNEIYDIVNDIREIKKE